MLQNRTSRINLQLPFKISLVPFKTEQVLYIFKAIKAFIRIYHEIYNKTLEAKKHTQLVMEFVSEPYPNRTLIKLCS